MDLSIIIVNWNSVEFLKKCLDLVIAGTQAINYEIIVIDSASFDGCEEMLREHYPEVVFIQCQENVGFAHANNIAFEKSCGSKVLFLNPDTEIDGSAINTIYNYLQKLPKAGAIGCKLLNTDRTIQTSCIQSFPTILNQILDSEFLRKRMPSSSLWGMAPLFNNKTEPALVDVISGACIMMERKVFEKIGKFSEEYFMYTEDIDLCYKAKQARYINYYVPEARIIHHGGGSSQEAKSNFAVVMMRESMYKFLMKTKGLGYAWGYRISILFTALVRLVALWISNLVTKRQNVYSINKWQAVLQWSLNRNEMISGY
ncbi:MAG: glycosyltransferase family 2 protein [Methylobacter sp.]|nr:glycosyltransferase family 2 protein [Methylobacter sp.]